MNAMSWNTKVWNSLKQTTIAKELQPTYLKAKPFPHMVFDNMLNLLGLTHAANSFNDDSRSFNNPWWKYDNELEKKSALDQYELMPISIKHLVSDMNSKEFTDFLENLTGITGLITDPGLNGGGMHRISKGGKLDVHADYNYHPKTKLDRRLNVLLYLNLSWKSEWKGNLELWDSEMKACQKSIEPRGGRMVVFSTTDTAFHGHPEPLECPDNVMRKSIAMYYYTNGRPEHERSEPHSTIFKKRPEDPESKRLDDLRRRRAIRRLP